MSIFVCVYNVFITQLGTEDKLMKITTHILLMSKQGHVFICF